MYTAAGVGEVRALQKEPEVMSDDVMSPLPVLGQEVHREKKHMCFFY